MTGLHLPPAIQTLLAGSIVSEVTIGCSPASVYQLIQDERTLYLKLQPVTPHASLLPEAQVLRWLQGKLPAPAVVHYECDERQEYLLLAEVAGVNCVAAQYELAPEAIVRILAQGLRMIHSIDVTNCPFDARLIHRLAQARYNVEHDLIDEDDFDDERRGVMTAREVLAAVERDQPPEDDLVFTHGDYCLPNVIVQAGALSGFVDWGRAGIADRYHDLALASRSIRYNLGEEYEPLFFTSYGIEQVDLKKIAYYQLLDELF